MAGRGIYCDYKNIFASKLYRVICTTHHEGRHEHRHEAGSHPKGYRHHMGECPYCRSGGFKTREEEIEALESYKRDIGEEIAFIDRRLEELRKG